MIHRRIIALSLALALVASLGEAFSTEGRGGAMGGAYSPLAKGAEGIWYNPGVLGSVTMFSGLVGGGVEFSNNALTMTEVKELLSGTDAKKREMLGKIAKKGDWDVLAEGAMGGSLSFMGLGLGIYPRLIASGKDVTADAVEYALFGGLTEQTDKVYEVKGKYGRSQFTELAIGYAHELPVPVVKLAAGAALKYYHGVIYEYVDADNTLDNNPAIPVAKGKTEYGRAESGKGMGFDLGLYAGLPGDMVGASLVLKNIASKIDWSAKVRKGEIDSTALKVTAEEEDKTVSQELPMTVVLGVGGQIPLVGLGAAAEFESDTLEKESRVRLGAEYSMLGVLALRTGYASGIRGSQGQVTLGAGLGVLLARVDAGVGIGLDQKGGSAAVSGSVAF